MRPDGLRQRRPSHTRRRVTLTALSVAALMSMAGCGTPTPGSGTQAGAGSIHDAGLLEAPASGGSGSGRPVAVSLPAPGTGVVVGRLVDAVTGLPVRDAGVSLLGPGQRTISGLDGGFRFDGVDPGTVTLVCGPVEGYVPRSFSISVPEGGLDLGITPLLPVDPPTMIVPEYGGIVAGCGASRLLFATEAFPDPANVSLSCIERADEFPASAPTGRLPLAVFHLSPAELTPSHPTTLIAELPIQPRYTAGVELDLLRLDLDRLIWEPTASLMVEPGGHTARGEITALGTYLVAAPPFGAFVASPGHEPSVTRFNLAAERDGTATDVFAAASRIVYASFDYARMNNTPVMVRTVDTRGVLHFELQRPYTDFGRENVPMVTDAGSWAVGEYITSIYVGQPPAPVFSVPWRVAGAATPTPRPPTPPPTHGSQVYSPLSPVPVLPRPPASVCTVRRAWWAYQVQRGDTLFALARRTDTTVDALYQANCLRDTVLIAGQTIFLPRPPARPRYVSPTRPPAVPRATPPPPPPLTTPTTWYTPPAATSPASTAPVPTQPAPTTAAPTQPPNPTAADTPVPTVAPPTQQPATVAPTVPATLAPTAPGFTPKATSPPLPEPTLAPRPTAGLP